MKPQPDSAATTSRNVDEICRENVETIGRIQREAEGHRTASEVVADAFATNEPYSLL